MKKHCGEMGGNLFKASMQRWLAGFRGRCDYPVAGIAPRTMRRITVPAIVIPGNDYTHPPAAAQAAHRLLRNSVYQEVLTSAGGCRCRSCRLGEAPTGTLAARFIDFLKGDRSNGSTVSGKAGRLLGYGNALMRAALRLTARAARNAPTSSVLAFQPGLPRHSLISV